MASPSDSRTLMMSFLGPNWAFLMTDITLGAAGNDESMAFLFDSTRLQPSGLACELVVPPEWLDEIEPDALKHQFVRTPYAVSFRRKDATFILVTLHVDYGDSSTDRIPELKGIARWMADSAARDQTSGTTTFLPWGISILTAREMQHGVPSHRLG